MIYALGFIMLFVIGGTSGIVLANPSVDFQVHNTLFLVAHFHNMLIPGTLFGMLAGYTMWFPKAFGFRLDESWGRWAAFGWIAGFILAFFPLYGLGLLGMPRRAHGFVEPEYLPFTLVALAGRPSGARGIRLPRRAARGQRPAAARDCGSGIGDPWDGRTLEWATSAPPPEYNFPVIPTVTSQDAFAHEKVNGVAYQAPENWADIEMPKNSALGPVLGIAGFFCAFGLVWFMWWLVLVSALAALTAIIGRSFVRNTTETIPAEDVRSSHLGWLEEVRTAPRATRARETSHLNFGRAVPLAREGA